MLIPLEFLQLGQSIGRHSNQRSNQKQTLHWARTTHSLTHSGQAMQVPYLGLPGLWHSLGTPASILKTLGSPKKVHFLGRRGE